MNQLFVPLFTAAVLFAASPRLGATPDAQSDGAKQPTELILECNGLFQYCSGQVESKTECDPKRPQEYLLLINGSSIKHLDDYGLMDHKETCKTSDSQILCRTSSEESGLARSARQITQIDRPTGKISHVYYLDVGEERAARVKGRIRYTKVEFEGKCIPRARRNLF